MWSSLKLPVAEMFHWVQLLLTFTSLTRHDGHSWQRRNCIFFTFVFVFVFVIVLHYLERGSQLRVQRGRIWAKTAQSADKAETKEPRRVRTVNAHSRYFSFRRFLQNVVITNLRPKPKFFLGSIFMIESSAWRIMYFSWFIRCDRYCHFPHPPFSGRWRKYKIKHEKILIWNIAKDLWLVCLVQ